MPTERFRDYMDPPPPYEEKESQEQDLLPISSECLCPARGRWKKRERIGQGAHGVVFVAVDQVTDHVMAVKQIDTNEISGNELAALQNEIDMMKVVSHDNIVRYYGTEHDKNILSIFMELAPGGSLQSQLRKNGGLEERTVKKYARQLLQGLKCLHDNEIAHRDIKSANLLLSADGTIKLADFGASKRMSSKSLIGGLKGTPHWMAPEVIKAEQTTEGWVKADVWSVGCTVIEMVTGHSPWQEYPNPMTAMYHIACGKAVPKIPTTISSKAQDFIRICLSKDPNDRPDVNQLLEHPFIKKRSSKDKEKKKIRDKKSSSQPSTSRSKSKVGSNNDSNLENVKSPTRCDPTTKSLTQNKLIKLKKIESKAKCKKLMSNSPKNQCESEAIFKLELSPEKQEIKNERSTTPVFPSLRCNDLPRPKPRKVSTAPSGGSSSGLSYKLPPLSARPST